MKQKKTEIKNWQIDIMIAVTILLVLTTGVSIGKGEWIAAICNAMWAFVSYTVARNARNAKSLIEEMEKVDDVLPYAAALAIIARHLKDESEHKKEDNEPSCSAENNDNIEFAHNTEGGKE